MTLRTTLSKVGRSRWLPVVMLLVVGFSIVIVAHPARAASVTPTDAINALVDQIPGGAFVPAILDTVIGGRVAQIFSHFLFIIISLFGHLLVVLISIMVQIAQFNNFTEATAVQQGWQVARDICNLLLVIVLLLIAWGTVLRIDSYHYRRMLPKFILMAILINFSKSICGFLIDISQVIMLSFVNAFKDHAYYNLTTGVGLEKILKFATSNNAAVSFADTAGALLLGLLLITLLMGAVIMLLYILLGRIIVLWILVVLSPVAYLGETISVLKKAATTWWKMFGDYLVVGPLVAFFLWLAMLIISINPGQVGRELTPGGVGSTPTVTTTSTGTFSAAVSEISTSDNLLSFILAVGLLFAASMAAQQVKTLGGGMGVTAYNRATGAARWIATAPAGKFNRWQASKLTGVDLNPVRNVRRVIEGFTAGKKREEADVALMAEKRAGRGGLLGLMATSAPSWESQYVGAGLKATGLRVWQGSTGPGELVRRGRDKKFENDKKNQISQKEMEIKALEQQERAILPMPDEAGRKQRIKLKEQIAQKKTELDKISESSRVRTRDEIKYGPNDRAYQRLLQSKVAEEAKNLPTTAEELVEHRNAAVAMGKGGMVTAMAANEKLMQLGRDDLVKGDHKDIVAAIEAMGAKLKMSKTDAIYHAGNVAAIGASKGKAEYMNLVTVKNGQPERQDPDKHSATAFDAINKNPGQAFRSGETSGWTSSERKDPSNPTSPLMPVLNEAGIASLLMGGIKPLYTAIQKGYLSPKFGFLGNDKNILILRQIEKLLSDANRTDEASQISFIIDQAKKIPQVAPGSSRAKEAIASAKNVRNVPPPTP